MVTRALKAFGVRVREARQKAGLTQHQLATQVRSSHTYMFELESGLQNVTVSSLAKIAYACGVEIRDLLPEPDNDAPPNATSIELLCSLLRHVQESLAGIQEQEARRQAIEATLAERLRGFSDMGPALEKLIHPAEDFPPAPVAPPPRVPKGRGEASFSTPSNASRRVGKKPGA